MDKKWWKESVVYQIYPRSFNDSDGDGIGDIQGIILKLDYLKNLGVDVIWLSPVYESPNIDNGYDISNYRKILDEFGTMEDWKNLLEEIHKRDMKLLMDLVVNHTSDEHFWFVEARKSKKNLYHNYYIWHPGKEGQKPNNWNSNFGGSAWEYDENIREYYLHLFHKKQPDLNWENWMLREEIYDMMTWWLEKGVDGFRMDVINFISKPKSFKEEENFINGPRIHEFLQEMNEEVLSKYDIMTVGEMPGITPELARSYTDEKRKELNMVFQFEHMDLDSGPYGKWDVKPLNLFDLKENLSKWQKELEDIGWNSLYFNNHDQPRSVSRWGNDSKYRVESAKMLATLLHMMKGTPYIYQGEELGMTNIQFGSIKEYKDIETLNFYQDQKRRNIPEEEIMKSIYTKSRDNARTPVQWDNTKNAGFTTGVPWLKVNSNYPKINAAKEIADSNSIYNYYKKLILLRKEYEVIVYGNYKLILKDHPEIFVYKRKLKGDILVVICNFYENKSVFHVPEDLKEKSKKLLVSNYEIKYSITNKIILRPYEARVYLFQQE